MFAYTSMAMDQQHVCAALMVFAQLHALGSKAERVLFYPQDWEGNRTHMPEHVGIMLKEAQAHYGVKLMPVKVHGMKMEEWPTEEFKGE